MNVLHKLLLFVTACGSIPIVAGTLSIAPPAPTVGVGQTFSLAVNVTGAVDLFAYQFDIGFDSAALAADTVSEGTFLAGVGSTTFFPGFIDNSGGTVSFIADSLNGAPSGANGDGTLATIDFTAIALGSSSIDIFNVIALNSFGEGVPLDTTGATINVTSSPEPTPMVLILALLVTLFALRRRKPRLDALH